MKITGEDAALFAAAALVGGWCLFLLWFYGGRFNLWPF